MPERRFEWRWHQGSVAPGVDYAAEPHTLVPFTLEDAPDGGMLLRVVESGFDARPSARRASALLGNTRGWAAQLTKRLPSYLRRPDAPRPILPTARRLALEQREPRRAGAG